MSRNVVPDQSNPYLELGRFIHEEYNSGLTLPGMKVDVLFEKNGMRIVGEVKKSSASVKGARYQLLYYLMRLEEEGLKARGEIIIPNEDKRIPVELDEESRKELRNIIVQIHEVLSKDIPPSPSRKSICRKCGYELFCFS
ncbi:CRISPR-associated protein Cas4 [Thermotoga sp. KOL6]|nr:CRISPR-associated protein Cas4 [Thermotoga sp. KOL6]